MPRKSQAVDEIDNGKELDPLIEAMLQHLPEPGEQFPTRSLWLQVMTLVLQLAYPEPAKATSTGPMPPTVPVGGARDRP